MCVNECLPQSCAFFVMYTINSALSFVAASDNMFLLSGITKSDGSNF